MLEYIITSKNWNCHTAYNIARLCRTYRVYYIIKKLCVSQEACGVLIWCACLLSCLLAEPDNNCASVFFPSGEPPPPPLPPRPHPLTHTRMHTTSSGATCWLAAGDIMDSSQKKKTGPLEGMTSLFITHETERERQDTENLLTEHLLIISFTQKG